MIKTTNHRKGLHSKDKCIKTLITVGKPHLTRGGIHTNIHSVLDYTKNQVINCTMFI